jgi:hypothetical protein
MNLSAHILVLDVALMISGAGYMHVEFHILQHITCNYAHSACLPTTSIE